SVSPTPSSSASITPTPSGTGSSPTPTPNSSSTPNPNGKATVNGSLTTAIIDPANLVTDQDTITFTISGAPTNASGFFSLTKNDQPQAQIPITTDASGQVTATLIYNFDQGDIGS